ncbi:Zn(II)2Cys6 transcription factor [Microthyrium microscopicum]|uniref:Zn(II)2Cys6 transcription factor n=1 Tax=Microthyrium microscopicum TaxID=703497 RepID=A0A6A6UB95_9PEZI|nr:Zn(II)2Cys6 transcription factor [Microthyrium microscopicum]
MDEKSPPRKLKRPRAAQACERCRLKKYKCDESIPCFHCKKSNLECVYQNANRYRDDAYASHYIQTLETKVRELTAQLMAVGSPVSQHSLDPENRVILTSNPLPKSLMPAADGQQTTSSRQSVSDEAGDTAAEVEIADVNRHTNAVEFHGSTSSMAFLGYLKRRQSHQTGYSAAAEAPSLVSALHNPAFSPQAHHHGPEKSRNIYSKQAHIFIEAYFENLHFVHPLIDKEHFMARANNLWFGHHNPEDESFVPLYLSLMSLGALVRVWDEERLDGLTRFEWSRKLFGDAQAYLNDLRFSNDLDTVQCLYFMAKVCQNELNQHLAYMYLGLAIRTCLSAGFNRESPNPKCHQSGTIAKTWWGIYSLEIEMSFSLGRPDTLGMDEYHNRRLPPIDDSEYAIIPLMVQFAHIIRKVTILIYHKKSKWQEKVNIACQIEQDMGQWVATLPEKIRPFPLEKRFLGALKEPKWCRRQRLVLNLRYHNVRMLLFRPFLSYVAQNHSIVMHEALEQAINKCLDSAKTTIELIHETYTIHSFFRTWWYNTTYVMFAVSVLLLYISRVRTPLQSPSVVKTIEMAVEILDAMDESVVARKTAVIIKDSLREAMEASAEPAAPTSTTTNTLATNSQLYVDEYLDMNLFASLDFPDYSLQDMASLFDEFSRTPHTPI